MNNAQFQETQKRLKDQTLDSLLQEITVQEIDESDEGIGTKGLDGWYGVVTDIGIIAYFGEEAEAYKFRLDYISRILNS